LKYRWNCRCPSYGGQENSIEVRLDEKVCQANGITMGQVRTLLNNNGRNKTFAGKVVDGNNELFVISLQNTQMSGISADNC